MPAVILDQEFFAHPVGEVARELLGCTIAVGRTAGMIVEVERYQQDDPASHSFRGPTPRAAVMFGPPGRLYVYRSYGVHWCANVVCEPPGSGAAVLLRALAPIAGLDVMRERRGGGRRPAALLRSGRLCAALGIERVDERERDRAGAGPDPPRGCRERRAVRSAHRDLDCHRPALAPRCRGLGPPVPPVSRAGGRLSGGSARALAERSVDVVPPDGLAAKLALGRPLRVKLGVDPHRPRHPPRSHRRPAEAARVPGRRTHRGPDHRRLDRPRRRSVRPLVDAADAVRKGDRRERRDVSRAGVQGARSGARGGAPQRRVVRRHGPRAALPTRSHDDGQSAAPPRGLRPAHVGAAAHLHPRVALPADAGLRLGGRGGRRRAGGNRSAFQPHAGREVQHATGSHPKSP